MTSLTSESIALTIANRLKGLLDEAVQLKVKKLWTPTVSLEFTARRTELLSLAKELGVAGDVLRIIDR